MPENNQSSTLLTINSLIDSHNQKLDTLTTELKEIKAMLNDILDNDAEYQEKLKEATRLNKLKNIAKAKVLKTPEAASVMEKIVDRSSQIKELKVALSDYLSQYVSLSGTNQIEGSDGVLRQIIYTAKLVKLK